MLHENSSAMYLPFSMESMLGTDITYRRTIYLKDLEIGYSFRLSGIINKIKLLIEKIWAEQINETKRVWLICQIAVGTP